MNNAEEEGGGKGKRGFLQNTFVLINCFAHVRFEMRKLLRVNIVQYKNEF